MYCQMSKVMLTNSLFGIFLFSVFWVFLNENETIIFEIEYAKYTKQKDPWQVIRIQDGEGSMDKGAHAKKIIMLKTAQSGDLNSLISAIESGANINVRDGNGYSSLHLAIHAKHKDIVAELLKRGADVKVLDREGSNTPLHIAANEGYKDIVGMLLKHDADVNVRNGNGYTPLHMAVSRGDKDIVGMLLERGADVNTAETNYGDTPLHSAVNNKFTDIIEILLEHGADANARNLGDSPRKIAYKLGNSSSNDADKLEYNKIAELLRTKPKKDFVGKLDDRTPHLGGKAKQ